MHQNRDQHVVRAWTNCIAVWHTLYLGTAVFFFVGLAACTFITSPTAAQAQWHQPAADIRISAAPAESKPHVMRVTIPSGCGNNISGIEARLANGTLLPASPVKVGEKIVAAEITISTNLPAWTPAGTNTDNLPVHLYLLEQEDTPTPPATTESPPFSVRRNLQKMMTRPYNVRQLMALEATLAKLPFTGDVFSLGSSLAEQLQAPPLQGHQVRRLHCATALKVAEETSLRLGADAPQTGWFLFVNGRHAVDWRHFEIVDGNINLSKILTLTPGLHRLDLFIIQRQNEALPELYWKRGTDRATVLPASELVSTHEAVAWQVQRRDEAWWAGAAIMDSHAYILPDWGQGFSTYSIRNLSHSAAEDPRLAFELLVDGDQRSFDDTLLGRRLQIPSFTVRCLDGNKPCRAYDFPAHFQWPTDLTYLQPRLLIADIPVILAPGAALEAHYRLDGIPDSLLENRAIDLAIAWRAFNGRHLLQEGAASIAEVSLPQFPLSLPVPPETTHITLELVAQKKLSISPPITIHILGPSSDFNRLVPRGERLLWGDDAAVLRPREQQSNPTHPPNPRTFAGLRLIDEFWAVHAAPGATLAPEQWLTQQTDFRNIQYLPVDERLVYDCVPELRKFAILDSALTTPGNAVVVWAVGTADLAEAHELKELQQRLLFLAQATLARNCLPIMMTAPPLPGVSEQRSRRAALELKRLCHSLGIPVVDVYSKALSDQQQAAPELRHFFVSGKGGLKLTTTNDAGRRWFLELVRDTLQNLQ